MSESPTTVALTGATGFVGRHVLAGLLEQGYNVRVLVRDASRLTVSDPRILPVHGDLFDHGAIRRLVDEADSVIHLVGIIIEKPGHGQTFDRVHVLGTRRLVEAAKAAGIRRWVQMSALGTRPNAVSSYHRTKWQAEQAVRDSGIDYTILRPSIIHGPDGEFMQMVKSFWCDRDPPFVPYFGTGLSLGEYIRLFKCLPGIWHLGRFLSRMGKLAGSSASQSSPPPRASSTGRQGTACVDRRPCPLCRRSAW